jgi:hypothetical protein
MGQIKKGMQIIGILEARAEIQKYFVCFLVQMKTSKFAFEIN